MSENVTANKKNKLEMVHYYEKIFQNKYYHEIKTIF